VDHVILDKVSTDGENRIVKLDKSINI